MSRCPLIFAWSAVALLACAAAVSCRPTIALADPPPAPGADDSRAAADNARAAANRAKAAADRAKAAADRAKAAADMDDAKLEAQLESARQQLDAAAHEVAELTAQLSRPVIEGFMDMDGEHGRAIIGVQLDPAASGPGGAHVREVSPGGPAAEAGIRAGDMIVAVNGTEVKGENPARTVMRLLRPVKPDAKVSVRVLRAGASHEFTVTARPGPGFFFADLPKLESPQLLFAHEPLLIDGPVMDLELVTLTPQLSRYFGSEKGVLVVRAPSGGALKLEDGDVILAIDGREVASGSHATRILATYQPGEKLTLHVLRQHKALDLETTLPERTERRHAEMRIRGVPAAPPSPPVPAAPPPPTPDT